MAEEFAQTESQPKRYQYERRQRKDYLTTGFTGGQARLKG